MHVVPFIGQGRLYSDGSAVDIAPNMLEMLKSICLAWDGLRKGLNFGVRVEKPPSILFEAQRAAGCTP